MGRIGRRLAALDRIDIRHAAHHPTKGRVIVVERKFRREHNEELAVGAVQILGARHRHGSAQVRQIIGPRMMVGDLLAEFAPQLLDRVEPGGVRRQRHELDAGQHQDAAGSSPGRHPKDPAARYFPDQARGR